VRRPSTNRVVTADRNQSDCRRAACDKNNQVSSRPPDIVEVLSALDQRVPRWSLSRLETRSCPFCASRNPPLLRRPDGLHIANCGPCGLWYISGVPCATDLRDLYVAYWHSHRPSELSAATAARMVREAKWQNDYRLFTSRLTTLMGTLRDRTILEVGCGQGGFLIALRELGATVYGSEVSPEAIEFLTAHLKIPVLEFPSPEPVSRPVDLIAMIDVIEHPADPLPMLEAARRLLVPGGLLLIWTPNGGQASGSVDVARTWTGFRLDFEHLQYLSPKTITMVARRFDWDIEHLETVGFPNLSGFAAGHPPRPGPAVREWFTRLPNVPMIGRARRIKRAVLGLRDAFWASPRPRDMHEGSYSLFAILRRR
jgi:2-polyprenyl-3-methyl-5-hydroxy-6-metoxy-1,4-benzoquinol methylase